MLATRRRAAPTTLRRNLLYHCCPLRANDLWERNLDQLLERIDVFDGAIHVAVSTGDDSRLHPVRAVQDRFRRARQLAGIHFVPIRNDRRLREVASFRELIGRVETRDPTQATFYAHTKGNATNDDVRGAIYWRNMMYHKLLDGWERCMELLRDAPAVGCNKMVWGENQRPPYPTALRHGRWMFAGTFFWFRNASVYAHPRWNEVPSDRYGAEAWLSGMFEPDECTSVFQPWREDKYPPPSPYDPELYARNGMAIEDIELRHPSYVI